MMTTSKHRLGWMALALLLVFTTLPVPPAQGAQCPLEACAEQCNEGCLPYGGHPMNCMWRDFDSRCVGICYCYYW